LVMPSRRLKPRAKPRQRTDLTPLTALALTNGPSPVLPGEVSWPPDDLFRALWVEHRDALMATQSPGTAPWAFWAYEPDVPDDLRTERPLLREAADEPAGSTPAERAAEEDLAERRRLWLAESNRATERPDARTA
jgi:hypothetical protein